MIVLFFVQIAERLFAVRRCRGARVKFNVWVRARRKGPAFTANPWLTHDEWPAVFAGCDDMSDAGG
jgi:hypothetical protein